LNYAKVESIISNQMGTVAGVKLIDMAPVKHSRQAEITSKAVINATGAWTDQLHWNTGKNSQKALKNLPDIRQLRGSHLVFSAEKVPVNRAISIWHPRDKRPVFIFPWEGVTVVGTTDVDYREKIVTDPCISNEEVEYLLEIVRFTFPTLNLSQEDILSTFSGIRSVVDTGRKDPSKESREHFLCFEDGLLTIAGGKLTTFRLMARQALNLIIKKIPGLEFRNTAQLPSVSPNTEIFVNTPIDSKTKLRLLGRYGSEAVDIMEKTDPSDFAVAGSYPHLWTEVRWAARAEGVIHLEDLLLRRVRFGNLLPNGGLKLKNKIKEIVQGELGWNDRLWDEELLKYKLLLESSYSVKS
jgi:glycerol-3-phosphate dehydrogenase